MIFAENEKNWKKTELIYFLSESKKMEWTAENSFWAKTVESQLVGRKLLFGRKKGGKVVGPIWNLGHFRHLLTFKWFVFKQVFRQFRNFEASKGYCVGVRVVLKAQGSNPAKKSHFSSLSCKTHQQIVTG